ncbi:hypothetical protein AJ88_24435 [Mesorhizobium amorphae CCBAU 01583]|nr:hypothetical protein AJ88_24435 [Mesorhizobium amorphae CCBAU 01583]
MALASSLPWGACSAGYVGISDGWQQLRRDGRLDPASQRAEDGNVALTGEIGFSAKSTKTLLALGFGATPEEAADNASASLKRGFEPVATSYFQNWRQWQDSLLRLDRHAASGLNTYRVSTAVLATHRSFAVPGAAVASLSIPWGFSKGDDDLGGYHLVWPRDLVETAGGFLAAGDAGEALRILAYLRSIQQPDGHWPQNAWLDGSAYWPGIQMDECAFPLLLADALRRAGHLSGAALSAFMPMIEQAASYVVRNGPVTGEDRWEEDAGYSPFRLPSRSPLCSRRRTCSTSRERRSRQTICARPPIAGTTRSSAGPMLLARTYARTPASKAIMSASPAGRFRGSLAEGRLCPDQEPAARRYEPSGRSDRQP